MVERKENVHRYQKLWKSIVIWLTNKSGWNVGGASKEDRRGDLDDRSDMDIDFWISKPHQKQEVYEDLIPKLRNKYRGSQVVKSTNQNVIMFVYDGVKIDINLLPKKEYMEKLRKRKKDVSNL